MGAARDRLEAEIGPRAVGSLEVDGRTIPLAFAAGEEQVVLLLQVAASHGWSVLPVGSGTKLARGPVRGRPRFAISLRGLSGVTAYERGDGTISARAGSAMAALREVARSGGNHLTPDVAQPEQATLGGTLASGASGIDRLRHGPVRHHVLGMRVALADGTITKCGGRLVKNVTGYDLHRLYTGSRGSLCVILEASLRLFPAPEREVVLSATYFARDSALAAAEHALSSGARPTCVCVAGPEAGHWILTVALSGRAEPVEWERSTIARLLGQCDVLEGADARAAVEAVRDREATATLRASAMPGSLAAVMARLDALSAAHNSIAGVDVHPGIACVDVTVAAAGSGATAADVVITVAHALAEAGAEVEIQNAPLEARAGYDPLERVPAPARALMARVKRAFDPASRFAADPERA